MNVTRKSEQAIRVVRELYEASGLDVGPQQVANRLGIGRSAACEQLARLAGDGFIKAVPRGAGGRYRLYRPAGLGDGALDDAVAALQKHGEHALANRLRDMAQLRPRRATA